VEWETYQAVVAELEGRSFRQFHPLLDESPRRGVLLDFRSVLSIWAQHSEDGHALNEW
jgi:hypothetical protein